MEQSTARFQSGAKVLLLSGEHEGQLGTVAASQEVEGKWQYGIAGIKGIGENLYAVHEHEINPATEIDMEEPVFVPEPPVNGTGNNVSVPQPTGYNLASQLQNVANMAASQDQVTHETFHQILQRLDSIDKRLEVKEIKVVVEVQHTYNRPTKEFETYSDEDRLASPEPVNVRAKVKELVNDNQLDFFSMSAGEEE